MLLRILEEVKHTKYYALAWHERPRETISDCFQLLLLQCSSVHLKYCVDALVKVLVNINAAVHHISMRGLWLMQWMDLLIQHRRLWTHHVWAWRASTFQRQQTRSYRPADAWPSPSYKKLQTHLSLQADNNGQQVSAECNWRHSG